MEKWATAQSQAGALDRLQYILCLVGLLLINTGAKYMAKAENEQGAFLYPPSSYPPLLMRLGVDKEQLFVVRSI